VASLLQKPLKQEHSRTRHNRRLHLYVYSRQSSQRVEA
jgi:hypothetical protein